MDLVPAGQRGALLGEVGAFGLQFAVAGGDVSSASLELGQLDQSGLVEVDQAAFLGVGGVDLAVQPGELGGEQLIVRDRCGDRDGVFPGQQQVRFQQCASDLVEHELVERVGAVCVRDPRRPAGCEDRGRQVAPGRAGQHRWSPRSGNASPATCSAAAARVADPVWVNRRLLLTGAEHLSAKQWRRLTAHARHRDPTGEIGAAWAREGTAPDAARRTRAGEDPAAAGRLLRRRDRRPAARSDPARRHHPDLVAGHLGRAHRGRLQRPHRRLQPHHQTNQTGIG